jgi:hypothetical protein
MMMIDYKSMSNDELREALAAAAAELMSRRNATGEPSSTQHLYRIRMTRTPKAEPQAYRFTVIEDTVVQLPLPLDQLVGKTGRVIGGEFLLNDGDVVRKVAATGMISYLIPWQGNIDDRDYDVSQVFAGETEAERIAKVETFVRGDRSHLIQEIEDTIAFWKETLPEYEEQARADRYWKRTSDDCRSRINRLEAMLRWAQQT